MSERPCAISLRYPVTVELPYRHPRQVVMVIQDVFFSGGRRRSLGLWLFQALERMPTSPRLLGGRRRPPEGRQTEPVRHPVGSVLTHDDAARSGSRTDASRWTSRPHRRQRRRHPGRTVGGVGASGRRGGCTGGVAESRHAPAPTWQWFTRLENSAHLDPNRRRRQRPCVLCPNTPVIAGPTTVAQSVGRSLQRPRRKLALPSTTSPALSTRRTGSVWFARARSGSLPPLV